MNHGEVGYSLYVLKDGRYHLFAGQKEVPWRRECRIDVAGETVEAMYKDHWGKYGDLWVKMPPDATSADGGGIGISGGENGKPLSITINADTEGEKVTGMISSQSVIRCRMQNSSGRSMPRLMIRN